MWKKKEEVLEACGESASGFGDLGDFSVDLTLAFADGAAAEDPVEVCRQRRDTYLKIKAKIKHLQKLKLNMFPAKIKNYIEKNSSRIAKKDWKKFGKQLFSKI